MITICEFNVDEWEDGHPCVMLSPILRYSEFNTAEEMLVDFIEELSLGMDHKCDTSDYINDSLIAAGKSLKNVKMKVNKSLKSGEAPYKDVYSRIIQCKVDNEGNIINKVIYE